MANEIKSSLYDSKYYYNTRSENELLRTQLENERSSFLAHWRDLSDNILPRRSRFYTADTNKGDRRNKNIIDATGTLAVRTLRSGMMAGITSPARPWFKLTMADYDLADYAPVKEYLDTCTRLIQSQFLKSNLYNVLPNLYGDAGVFATGGMLMDEMPDGGLGFISMPIGSYYIGSSNGYFVDIVVREFRMTVRQVIMKFGQFKNGQPNLELFSDYIKWQYLNGQTESWVEICHVIKPNRNYDPSKGFSKFKKYVSVYYEKGSLSTSGSSAANIFLGEEKILRESGYDYFPARIARWETTGEDWWGTDCPGMVALGDIKQLQLGEKRSMQAIEKMIYPPMVGPTRMKNAKMSLLPGDITFVDEAAGGTSFRSAHDIRFSIQELEGKQGQVRQRISRAFFEDLFLMLASSDRRQITAREIEERHEEKLLAIGPVLEQLNQDVLDPLIESAYSIGLEKGWLPQPPEEIQGAEFKVEYLSIMAQAQKLSGLSGVERFLSTASNLAAIYPRVRHKIDDTAMVNYFGDTLGVPQNLIRPDEEAQEMEQAEAQAQQQAQQAQEVAQGASVAKDLSQVQPENGSLLSDLLEKSGA